MRPALPTTLPPRPAVTRPVRSRPAAHRAVRGAVGALLAGMLLAAGRPAHAQSSAARPSDGTPASAPAPVGAVYVPNAATRQRLAEPERVTLAPGRSYPVTLTAPVGKVAVVDADVADVVAISDREVVINGRKPGSTDVILWAGGRRFHYRVKVGAPDDRPQYVLGITFAEVRRDFVAELGAGVRGVGSGRKRVGTGLFNTDAAVNPTTGTVTAPAGTGFLTFLSDFGTDRVLAFLETQQQSGNARILAEPRLMAADREEASFLAGGEVPIPIATPGAAGVPFVTIQWREFGVRLAFSPEQLGDSLVKLKVKPEVSSLDYSNALTLQGFRVPALRARRTESTVDVPVGRSLVISGLLNDERERVRTGVPFLMDVPLLGALFSSTRWQKNESELVVIVTPYLVNTSRAEGSDAVRLVPPRALPAAEVVAPRLEGGAPAGAPARPAPAARPR